MACADSQDAADVRPLYIHAIYLINLASAERSLVARSRGSLVSTLRAGARMRSAGVITHIGSHGGRGFDAVAEQVAEAIRDILDRTDETTDLILENSAGAGGIIGSTLQELETLLRLAGRPPRLTVALDTAHLCGAGWNFMQDGEARRLVKEVHATIGFDRLAVVHANDSQAPPGSRRDRHANVGEGFVGLEGFRSLLAQPQLRAVPWILETPDLDTRLPPERRFGSLATLHTLREELSRGTSQSA
jgi:deoxyribonuclease-4